MKLVNLDLIRNILLNLDTEDLPKVCGNAISYNHAILIFNDSSFWINKVNIKFGVPLYEYGLNRIMPQFDSIKFGKKVVIFIKI